MTARALAFCFQIHAITPIKLVFVGLAFINVMLMLALAGRVGWPWRAYLACAGLSSLFRYSPIWHTAYDWLLVGTAAIWVWTLLPAGRANLTSRAFSVGIGAALLGVVMLLAPMDWPGYSPSRYHARIYAAVSLTAATAMISIEPWVRTVIRRGSDWEGWDGWTGTAVRVRMDWRAVIATAWFLIMWMNLVQWRTDRDTREYWVWYWRMALAAKVGWLFCLCAWIWLQRANPRSRPSARAANVSAHGG